jgi:hypothetical protein
MTIGHEAKVTDSMNGPTPNPTIIHPNGPPRSCLSSTIIIIIGLTSESTEDPLSQGSPSITYRDTTARSSEALSMSVISSCSFCGSNRRHRDRD